MNFLCHVNCCNNQGVISGVTYHKFPKTVAELWFSAHYIPIRKVENVSEMIVCSDHFKLADYTDTKLKNGAIPSLYLKTSKDDAFSINKEDKSCVELRIKADIKQINITQLPVEPNKLLNVTVLQKNNDPETFVDKNMEFTDIIAITGESDMLTAINSMHNYSISAQTQVNTNEQNKLLPREKSAQVRTGKKAPCFKNQRKLRNKKESIQILLNRKIKSHIKNIQENTSHKVNEEELIENIILDHDYSIPDDLGKYNGTAYNIICSENYLWKMKKQLGYYSQKTRSLRKRLVSLKSAVDCILQKRSITEVDYGKQHERRT
ncbi:hypothetical protein CBL_11494 [Carabus blaptoides fortunei]